MHSKTTIKNNTQTSNYRVSRTYSLLDLNEHSDELHEIPSYSYSYINDVYSSDRFEAEISPSQDASTSAWNPLEWPIQCRSYNNKLLVVNEHIVQNDLYNSCNYSNIPINSLSFSSVINLTKKFRRKTIQNFSSFVRTTETTAFKATQTIKRGIKNLTSVTQSIIHQFLEQHRIIEQRKSSNCSIFICEKNLFIQRLLKCNRYLIKWILIIFLYSIFLIASTSTEALNTKFNDDERRIIRKLFLKKFGLEQLNQHINDDEYSRKGKRTLRQIPDYIWDAYHNNEFDTVHHYFPSSSSESNDKLAETRHYNETLHFDLNGITNRNLVKIEFRMSTTEIHKKCNFNDDNTFMKNHFSDSCGQLKLRYGSSLKSKIIRPSHKWVSIGLPFEILSDEKVSLNVEYEGVPIMMYKNQDQSLVLFFNDDHDLLDNKSVHTRIKRSSANARPHKRRKHRKHTAPIDANECKRTSLYVDFAELNWQDWIMAPVGYEAYQCRGRCTHPMPSHLNTTNHAIVQSLINSIDPSAAPPPTCVPIEMSAISILYRDINDVVVVKTYPDMRVETCGCH